VLRQQLPYRLASTVSGVRINLDDQYGCSGFCDVIAMFLTRGLCEHGARFTVEDASPNRRAGPPQVKAAPQHYTDRWKPGVNATKTIEFTRKKPSAAHGDRDVRNRHVVSFAASDKPGSHYENV
jgi:hypothetical protein